MLTGAKTLAKWLLGGIGIGIGAEGVDGAGNAVRWVVIGGVAYLAYKNRAAIGRAFR